jgi:hypothetical protein
MESATNLLSNKKTAATLLLLLFVAFVYNGIRI